MYHLLSGLYEHLTRKEEFSVVILGLENSGKTTFLERVKSLYTDQPGLSPEQIGPTIGQNLGRITLSSSVLQFWDLGGQRDIRSIWTRYYTDCHAVAFVVDSTLSSSNESSPDVNRDGDNLGSASSSSSPSSATSSSELVLEEASHVFTSLVLDRTISNNAIPILVLVNKQDSPSRRMASEIEEVFKRRLQDTIAENDAYDLSTTQGKKGKGKRREEEIEDIGPRGWGKGVESEIAVMPISALKGEGVREAVDWLFLRVQNSRKRPTS